MDKNAVSRYKMRPSRRYREVPMENKELYSFENRQKLSPIQDVVGKFKQLMQKNRDSFNSVINKKIIPKPNPIDNPLTTSTDH